MLRCSINQTSKFIIISNYSSSTTCCLQTLSCLQRAHLILQPTTKIQTYIIRVCNFYETQWFVICTFGIYKLQPTTVCKLLHEKGYRMRILRSILVRFLTSLPGYIALIKIEPDNWHVAELELIRS